MKEEKFRDFQRSKVYKVEESWSGYTCGRELSHSHSRKLINSISEWANITPPVIMLNARNPKGKIALNAKGDSETIKIPLWAENIPTIRHEMAHVINYRQGNFDGHGPNFCALFIEIIHQCMGNDLGNELQWLFEMNSIKVEYNNTNNSF